MNRDRWTLTRLVARRELREPMGARSFRISTVVLVVAIACAVGIPALVGGGGNVSKVGVLGGNPTVLSATVREAGNVLGERVRPVACSDLGTAEARLRSGDLDALYVARGEVLIAQEPAQGASDTKAQLAAAIAQLARTPYRATVERAPALRVRGLKAPPTSLSTRLTGLAVVVLIYLLVFVYGQRITSGVVEEKSSRAAEVLLASVRPSQLLTGKALGMGVTAFAQVGACW